MGTVAQAEWWVGAIGAGGGSHGESHVLKGSGDPTSNPFALEMVWVHAQRYIQYRPMYGKNLNTC